MFAPTAAAIRADAIPMVWRAAHDDVNPTHYMDWDDSAQLQRLRPHRTLHPREEVTFEYGWVPPTS